MGMSRKQIAFDLSHEALKQHYPHKDTARDPQFFKRAYKDIQRFMASNGFERRQHSVYVSTGEMTTLDVAVLMQRMSSQLPWLGQCAEKVHATDIGAQHSLLGLLRPSAQLEVSLDRQTVERDGSCSTVITPSSIAAKYCDFLHECYPLPEEADLRTGQIAETVRFIQQEGKAGVSQLKLAVKWLSISFADNAAVQELAKLLTEELSQYQKLAPAKQPKRLKKISRER
jgi:virulence-associated protein VapD